jgi:hypothetical protein
MIALDSVVARTPPTFQLRARTSGCPTRSERAVSACQGEADLIGRPLRRRGRERGGSPASAENNRWGSDQWTDDSDLGPPW